MRKRTLAREIALQALYQYDLQKKTEPIRPEALESFVEEATGDPAVREYARILLGGTIHRMEDLDTRIAAAAQNWKLGRMAPVDRCILRLAIFELLESEDVPPKVAINEAVDLAKKFSTEQSGAFVNGILDKIFSELRR